MLYNEVMIIPSQGQALEQAVEILCGWLGCDPSQIAIGEPDSGSFNDHRNRPDAIISLNGAVFIAEYKRSGKVNFVAEAIRLLEKVETDRPDDVKLLIVPYMWEAGAERCREAGISWLDLSGNADIVGSNIRVYVEGRPNQFKKVGRPTNIFAPKSSRVARVLIYNPSSSFFQRELSERTVLGEGYISKIVRELEKQSLIERIDDGAVGVSDPTLFLDAWTESYKFSKHTIIRGHIPARSGMELVDTLGKLLSREGIKHAATGLAAGWLYTQFAAFRIVTFFVDESIDARIFSSLGFTETETGSNTWLVIPNDRSVFWESKEISGIQCVHPIQAYLDLKEHPERSEEAASELRRLILQDYK